MVALGGLFSLMSTCVDVTVRIGVTISNLDINVRNEIYITAE